MSTSGSEKSDAGTSLAALLAALQQGVVAINNLTQTMSSIFPST